MRYYARSKNTLTLTWSKLLLVVITMLSIAGLSNAADGSYNLTVLYTPGDTIDGHTTSGALGAAINDTGTVAFRARIPCGQETCPAIFQTSITGTPSFVAGPGSTIAGQAVTPATGDRIEIDNNGTIYFFCTFPGGGSGICTQSSIIAKTGDTIGGVALQGISAFAVSKSGSLVFTGTFGSRQIGDGPDGTVSRRGLFTPTALLVKSCEIQSTSVGCYLGGAPGDQIGGAEVQGIDSPTINNSGVIAFDCAPMGVCTPSAIVAQSGTTIGGTTLTHVYAPSINNNGTIAFVGHFNTPSGDSQGIFTPSSSLVKSGDTIDGHVVPQIGGAGSAYLSLGDDGTVVFGTIFQEQSPSCPFTLEPRAVLTQTQLVAESCDTIGGNLVRLLAASEESINSSGDIVFDAEYLPQEEDAIVVAIPAVGPTTYPLTTSVSPAGAGSISASPTSQTGYYNSGATVQLTAIPANGYAFSEWSGDLSGGTNPQSVLMSQARNVTAIFTPVGTAATVVSVTPSSGSGATQSFSFTYQSNGANGYQDIQFVQALFAVATDGGGQAYCLLHYDRNGNGLWLYSDIYAFFQGPVTPGTQSNLLQGALCALNTSGSSVTTSGNTLILNASVIFKQARAENVYLRAISQGESDTGWVQRGTWNSTAAPLGTTVVSPNAGSGSTQTFTLTYPDPAGFAGAAFGWVQFLVAEATDGGGQPFCFLHYDRAGNALWMYSSDVGYFVGPVTPGTSSNLLSSTACSINTSGTTVTNTNGNLVVTVPVTLNAPMSGAKKIYQRTLDVLNRDTGWQQTGTWTIP
jgi:hypothetical protein